ncbi:MAG: hypothetical protein HQL50_11265 [Magnetococcales bacterium]|nr:hypothetical protein [Magnetococcales bacterium]
MSTVRGGVVVVVMALIVALAPPVMAEGPESDDRIRDPLALLEELERRRKTLDTREKALNLRAEELGRLEKTLEKRIETLSRLRSEIDADLKREKDTDTANTSRLAKIYSSMKAKDAAEQIRNLDRPTAVRVMRVMREKTAAKVLGRMDLRDAVALGNALGMPVAQRRQRR